MGDVKQFEDGPRVLVVAGDVTVDWNLARTGPRQPGGWAGDTRLSAHQQLGGAALLADVLRAVTVQLETEGVTATVERPVDPAGARSFALWSSYADGTGGAAWRVDELLGIELRASGVQPEPDATSSPVAERSASRLADLVVLDDAALGLRDDPARWPAAITDSEHRPWVVLKMATPVVAGALWEHLVRTHAERLVTVMTVGDLRRTEVQVSQELSWERTAQDLVWELVYNPRINGLARCAHTVVSFGAAGAVVLSQRAGAASSEPDARLVFDPAVIEGMWEQRHPGGMIGSTVALTAGIVRSMMHSSATPDVLAGVRAGLTALRALHVRGYDATGDDPRDPRVAFPFSLIAASLAGDPAPFSVAEVKDPAEERTGAEASDASALWTILRDRYPRDLDGLAERIALEGPEAALEGVPLGRFGALLTIDRHEIEAFRSVRTLLAEYARRAPVRPLSIAVFGAPGSGKSFAVKQVAKAVLPEKDVAFLTFNVAQFDSPDDLTDALHQVRDVGLRGRLPLVFWDEFDTAIEGRSLGWLRYFLAPMQDGEFQEGQIVHPIGHAVFVFAGGTASSMDAFGSAGDAEAFAAAKGPDFVSRLWGFVNVLGPNRRLDDHGAPDRADEFFVVRRAILLRAFLEQNAPAAFHARDGRRVLDIDQGVLRAFLQVPEYKHGARSMESIISTSRLAGLSTFERSSLPTDEQLDLHVDGRAFFALVEEPRLEGELLERLARAAHEVFCAGLRERGYRYGPANDEVRKVSSALCEWEDLEEAGREASRANVRDVPGKLAHLACFMVPTRGDDPPFTFEPDEIDALARAEHDRWVAEKVAAGWRRGAPTDKVAKVHEALVPWEELPDDQREKDRDLVVGIPQILARAGYTVLRARRSVPRTEP